MSDEEQYINQNISDMKDTLIKINEVLEKLNHTKIDLVNSIMIEHNLYYHIYEPLKEKLERSN